MKFIKISCLGDLLAADTTYSLGNGIGSNMPALIEYYSRIQNNPFPDSDILFCNLESPLISDSDLNCLPFAGNPAVIGLLKVLGISIVSLANNHMPDHGRDGFDQTKSLLSENGLLTIGLKEGDSSNIIFKEIKAKKFAFAAFNAVQDHPENNFIAPLEKNVLFNTLGEIKKQSPDYIVLSFHWGNEYIHYPSPEQIELAHEMIDAGVNVIIGHHPHVVQPIEKYHDGIIMYSLGNFLFDMFWSEKVRNGMQVDLIFKEDNSIDYLVKPFRIRNDFTQDYNKTAKVFSILEKSLEKLKNLQSDQKAKNQEIYMKESKKQNLLARIQMKLYLLVHIFSLSKQSRILFLNKIKKLTIHTI